MSWWLDAFRAFWPVAVTLGALCSTAIFLWLATKFVSKEDHKAAQAAIATNQDAMEERQHDHETRIKMLEDHVEASPTRQELHDEMSALTARVAAVETGLKGIGRQLDTTNRYLHTLIDKAMPGAPTK